MGDLDVKEVAGGGLIGTPRCDESNGGGCCCCCCCCCCCGDNGNGGPSD